METLKDYAGALMKELDARHNALTLIGRLFTSTAKTPPEIAKHPADLTVIIGSSPETITFSVEVTGSGPLTYQWQWTPHSTGGGAPVDIAGANAAEYSFPAALSNSGYYRAVVSNAYGSVTSNSAFLTVIHF